MARIDTESRPFIKSFCGRQSLRHASVLASLTTSDHRQSQHGCLPQYINTRRNHNESDNLAGFGAPVWIIPRKNRSGGKVNHTFLGQSLHQRICKIYSLLKFYQETTRGWGILIASSRLVRLENITRKGSVWNVKVLCAEGCPAPCALSLGGNPPLSSWGSAEEV